MPPTRISLTRVVQLHPPVAWHEAVAVAQATARAARDRGVSVGFDSCVLTTEGAVEVTTRAGQRVTGEPLVAVLNALLDRAQAPTELGALVACYEGVPGTSIDWFAGELAQFARPDEAAEISALAARALALDADAAAQQELEKLRSVTTDTPPPVERAPRRVGRGAVVAVGAAFAVILGVAFATTRSSAVVTRPAATAAMEQVATRVDAVIDAGLQSLGLMPVAEAPKPVTPSMPTLRPARRARRDAPVAPAPSALAARRVASLREPIAVKAAVPENAVMDMPAVSNVIYVPGDPMVDAPVLVRPQLPRLALPMASPSALTYFELLVNESGTVDEVRLRAQRVSLRERMLVSAAKAWVFQPALKEGVPVKYLLRVPITHE